jgi:hypothetical protein
MYEYHVRITLLTLHQENTAGLIELEETDDSILEAVLRFMYYFDYNNIHGVSTMIFNAQVYSPADKYVIPALKGLAEEKFRTAVTIGWAMDDFPLAVAEVYSSTPEDDRGLRDLAVEVARTNIKSLVQDEQFRSLLKESPCFAADVVISMSSYNDGKLHTYKCRNCSRKMDVAISEGSSYYCIHCGSHRSDWKVFDDGNR